jgi:hypothetical protein
MLSCIQSPIRGSRDGELALSVSIAAIDQFKVEQSFRMPDQGANAAAVNIVTKSGSNQFHGEAFEFLRNADLDARSFFAIGPEDLKQNQFGVALGGRSGKTGCGFTDFMRDSGKSRPSPAPDTARHPRCSMEILRTRAESSTTRPATTQARACGIRSPATLFPQTGLTRWHERFPNTTCLAPAWRAGPATCTAIRGIPWTTIKEGCGWTWP